LVASLERCLEEGQQQLQTVAGLDFLDELIDRDALWGHRAEQALDDVLVTVDVKETTNDAGSAGWVDTLNIDLDGLELLGLVKVEHQVVDKVETVANDDQRQLLGQVGLLEEVLDLLRVQAVALTADTLDFLELAHLGGGLDVLEGDLLILGDVDNASEVEVKTLSGTVLLKKVNNLGRTEQIRVLLGDVDDSLQVLADVDLEHLVEALKRELDSETAEVVQKELFRDLVGLNDAALDRCRVFIVLQSPGQETSVLAKLGDAGFVVV
jgi:hypothetical protein